MKRNIIKSTMMTFVLAGTIAILFSGCSKELNDPGTVVLDQQSNEVAAGVSQNGHQYVQNEFLVKFKAGTSTSARLNALTKVNGSVAEKILTNAMKHSGDNEGGNSG